MKRPLLVLIAFAMLAACGGETSISPKSVAGIMPSAADAPAGTNIDTTNVGAVTLDEFVSDTGVRERLSTFGFRLAYVSSFMSPNFVADKATAPLGTAFYGTSAILLRDEEAAAGAFAYYRERLQARAKDFNAFVLDEELGTEAFAFRFSSLDDTPLPGMAMLFRFGNALFSVVGVGNPGPDPAVTRALATEIAGRAEAAA